MAIALLNNPELISVKNVTAYLKIQANCNSSRPDLPYLVARELVEFQNSIDHFENLFAQEVVLRYDDQPLLLDTSTVVLDDEEFYDCYRDYHSFLSLLDEPAK